MISNSVVVLTKDEFEAAKKEAFARGVERGRFEETWDRTYGDAKKDHRLQGQHND
jgi:hypothetical protein